MLCCGKSSDIDIYLRGKNSEKLEDLAAADKIPPKKIMDVLKLFMYKAEDLHNDTRANAVYGINKIIENKRLPENAKTIHMLINFLMAMTKDKYMNTIANALSALSNICTHYAGYIHSEQLNSLFQILLETTTPKTDENVKSQSLYCMSKFIDTVDIPPTHIDSLLDLFVNKSQDTDVFVRSNAIYNLGKLTERGFLTESMLTPVLKTLIANSKSMDKRVSANARWASTNVAKWASNTTHNVEVKTLLLADSQDFETEMVQVKPTKLNDEGEEVSDDEEETETEVKVGDHQQNSIVEPKEEAKILQNETQEIIQVPEVKKILTQPTIESNEVISIIHQQQPKEENEFSF